MNASHFHCRKKNQKGLALRMLLHPLGSCLATKRTRDAQTAFCCSLGVRPTGSRSRIRWAVGSGCRRKVFYRLCGFRVYITHRSSTRSMRSIETASAECFGKTARPMWSAAQRVVLTKGFSAGKNSSEACPFFWLVFFRQVKKMSMTKKKMSI